MMERLSSFPNEQLSYFGTMQGILKGFVLFFTAETISFEFQNTVARFLT